MTKQSCFFMRCGSLGEVYRIQSHWELERQQPAIVRLGRGIRWAETIGPCGSDEASQGAVIRPADDSDQTLFRRMRRYRRRAIERCQHWLREQNCSATLMDIDWSFDGRDLEFHFLGELTNPMEEELRKLTETFDEVSGARQLSRQMIEGCGPGCGTSAHQGGGCEDNGCSGCAC